MSKIGLIAYYIWCAVSGYIAGTLVLGQSNLVIVGGLLVVIGFNSLLYYLISRASKQEVE